MDHLGAIFPIAFVVIVVFLVVFSIAAEIRRKKKIASLTIVTTGHDYPNNFHVLGVGYYHATSRAWFPQAWNEYREGRGYYWGGKWNATPDLNAVSKSTPSAEEVERFNQAWRNADPDRTERFWSDVERDGFGTAIRRSEGS